MAVPRQTRAAAVRLLLGLAVSSVAGLPGRAAEVAAPETVAFAGPGQQGLVGFLFHPRRQSGSVPAIVMLHGRAGPYSTRAGGLYTAATLSKRHVFWGRAWAAQGYMALLVDSFGPRGFPAGFPIHSYADRPQAVSETDVRPLDAYAALAYLRTRPDVDHRRIALQGWSNGGSALLATMADDTLRRVGLSPGQGFAGAVAFYPACGLHGLFDDRFKPNAPVLILSGEDDEEVSAQRCAGLVEAGRAAGGDMAIRIYPGATHDFDDPGERRQSLEANALARADAVPRAEAFVSGLFKRPVSSEP